MPRTFSSSVNMHHALIGVICYKDLNKPKGGEMTYGYIRVSSDKQTVENQRFEINNFCASTFAWTDRHVGTPLLKPL